MTNSEQVTKPWIIVTDHRDLTRRVAINPDNIMCVAENTSEDIALGKRSTIYFTDGTIIIVSESFDEIGAQIR